MLIAGTSNVGSWRRIAGAAVVVFAAMASMVYSILAGELSFLAIYLVCLITGVAVAAMTAGPSLGQFRGVSIYLVVYSVNVLMILAFAEVLTKITGGPFLDAPEGVVPDDARFYRYGTSIADAWLRGHQPELPLGVKFYGYPMILAVCNYFSAIFGDISSVSPRLLNAAAGALLPVTVFRIAELVYENKHIATIAALLTATFPIFTFYSALLLRDIIIAYLVAMSVLFFLQAAKPSTSYDRTANAILLTATLLAIFFIRDLSAAVPLAGFALYIFVRQSGLAKAASLLVVAALVIQVLAIVDLDGPKLKMYLTYTERAMEVFTRIESQESLGMRYVIGAPFPFNILLRFPYTAIMPGPPMVGTNLLDIVRGSGAIIWYFLFPLWLFGMWRSRKNLDANLLTFISLLFLAGIAMVSIDLRHKTQYLPLAMIQVAYAIDVLKVRSEQVIAWTCLILGLLALIYFYLRFAL
jgi:hypothetical protein